jgi:hypothetical protein
MYDLLHTLHSWTRWLVLILGIYAIVNSYLGWKAGREFFAKDKKINMSFVGSLHLQFLLGIILFFQSPNVQNALANMGAAMKDKMLRFWSVEHTTMMVIAIIVAQVGSIVSKKAPSDSLKFKKAFIWFSVAMIIILVSIAQGISGGLMNWVKI